jgi:hypothetical protein
MFPYLWVLICISIQFWFVLNILSNVQVRRITLAADNANSHVMQYGDLSMDKDCIHIYFSAHHTTCSNDNNTYCISIKFAYLISVVLFVIALYITWTKCSNWCSTLVQYVWIVDNFEFSLIWCLITNTCWRLFWKGIDV